MSNTGQQVIHLQVGGCGQKIGNALWQQISKQHAISPAGELFSHQANEKISTYYSQSRDGLYQPRTIVTDFDSRSCDQAFASKYGSLLKLQNCLYGGGSSGNNWAKGFYSSESDQLIYETMDSVRQQVELCDSLQGFQMSHSICGGTGSGFGCRIMKQIKDEYASSIMVPMSVFPSDKVSIDVNEIYNAGISISRMIQYAPGPAIMIDNESVIKLHKKQFKMDKIEQADVNYMIARNLCDFTSTQRYCCHLNQSFRKMYLNLFPFPQQSFLSIGGFPILNQTHSQSEELPINSMVNKLVYGDGNNISGIQLMHGRYLTSFAIFRGLITTKQCEEATLNAQNRGSSPFVQWIPNNISYTLVKTEGGKIGVQKQYKNHDLPERSCTMIQNSTAQQQNIQKIRQRYSIMLKRKCFVHWYLNEGMELCQLLEAEQKMKSLISFMKHYQDATAEQEMDEQRYQERYGKFEPSKI